MWIDLPNAWIALLNVVAIPSIHLGISWIFTRLPRRWFAAGTVLFRPRAWERHGLFYERFLAVRSWKDHLPDAAPWFKGFPKKNLMSRDANYLRTFRDETCRGEAAHHAQVAGLLVTLLWNPWPVAASVMIAYAFLSNLPCIIVQRHTRLRIGSVLAVLARKAHKPGSD